MEGAGRPSAIAGTPVSRARGVVAEVVAHRDSGAAAARGVPRPVAGAGVLAGARAAAGGLRPDGEGPDIPRTDAGHGIEATNHQEGQCAELASASPEWPYFLPPPAPPTGRARSSRASPTAAAIFWCGTPRRSNRRSG